MKELFFHDVLKVVEESRKRGEILESFNSTFISLISKVENPPNFNDFRPISLGNGIYKIIAKIIAIRIKVFLSNHIYEEQFGFL